MLTNKIKCIIINISNKERWYLIMENTFKALSMEKMSMLQLVQLKQSIDKEITSRKEKEREEAEKEIFKLLNTIQNLCDKYDIELYDDYGNFIHPDRITT